MYKPSLIVVARIIVFVTLIIATLVTFYFLCQTAICYADF